MLGILGAGSPPSKSLDALAYPSRNQTFLDDFNGTSLGSGWIQAIPNSTTVSNGLANLNVGSGTSFQTSLVSRTEKYIDGKAFVWFAPQSVSGKSLSALARVQINGACYCAVIQNGNLECYALDPTSSAVGPGIGQVITTGNSIPAGFDLTQGFGLAISVTGSSPTFLELEVLALDGTCVLAWRGTSTYANLQKPGSFGMMNFAGSASPVDKFEIHTYPYSPPRPNIVLGFVGNSITRGYGTSGYNVPGSAATLPGQIGAKLQALTGIPTTVLNRGSNGSRTINWVPGAALYDGNDGDGAKQLLSEAISMFCNSGVNVISVMLATNDSCSDVFVSVADHKSRMQAIIQALLDGVPGARVVLTRDPYYAGGSPIHSAATWAKMPKYWEATKTLADGDRILLGDQAGWAAIAANPAAYLGDQLHLNDPGSTLFGSFGARGIAKALGIL